MMMAIKKYLAAIQNPISEQNWTKNKASDLCNDSEVNQSISDDNNGTKWQFDWSKEIPPLCEFLKSAVDECFYFTIWTGS